MGIVTLTLPAVRLKPLASGLAEIENKIRSYEFPIHLSKRLEDAGLRTGIQMPVMGQEDCPEGVRDVLGFVVEGPFNFVGLSGMPHVLVGRAKDLGGPHIPGNDVYRGGED